MLEVRRATEDDVVELATLNYEFNEINVCHKHIVESLKNNQEIIALAMFDKQIIGFACAQCIKSFCYEALSGEITELYVKEEFRRKGTAKALISFLENELNLIGVNEIKIITNVRNEIAKSVYQNIGYRLKNWVVLLKNISN